MLSEIPQALSALLTSLLKLPNLHTIDLSDNAFGLNTVAPLQPFLSQHTPLRHLYLNNNGLGPAAGTLVAESLVQLASNKSSARESGTSVPDLETIICGRNRLETGSMSAWAKVYQANTSVKCVKMVQNGIRQAGISSLITDGLSHCTRLQVLDLQDNTFTATGSRALAEVVSSGNWKSMKELGVGECLLYAKGGMYLASALQKGHCAALQTLRLQYNDINATGLRELAEATKALPQLRRMELNGNKFSEDDEAVDEIRRILEKRRVDSGEEESEEWGIDELDELESDDEEEEDEEGVDDESDEEEKIVKEAQQTQAQPVAQEQDKDVDELANTLDKAEIRS